MAVTKLKKVKAGGQREVVKRVAANPCFGCNLECSTCLKNGTTTLRKQACQQVRESSAEFAKRLIKKALRGEGNSATLWHLLSEPEGEKVVKAKTGKGRSLALELAEEPKWQEPVEEATAETVGGIREPEM